MEYNELEEYEEYDEYYNELDENEAELASIEESAKIKNGQVEFSRVNHSKRAEKFGRNSDGEVAKYVNYALEYFGHRCALSGEKFYKFDEKISGRVTNLSAEHVIALAIGGHDIVPNIVPTVLQYNIQKNGYYILDWWEKQEDINGKKIYSPYRLLKLVNFMMKSIEGRGLSARKYHELLMKPNEIDKYLEKIEKEDLEENDNNKRKILSDTVTATTLDEDNNKILTTIPSTKGNIADQVEDEIKRKEYNETEMMDTFLIDAVRVIKREKEISQEEIEKENGNKITIENKLDQMLEKTIGKIPFEINIRNKILEQLEEIGIENNKYTVASVILKNTDILEKAKDNKIVSKYVKELVQTRIKNDLKELTYGQGLRLISVEPDLLCNEVTIKEYKTNLKVYSEYINTNMQEIDSTLLTRMNFKNIIQIKKWMMDNNTTTPPSSKSKNDKEKRLGRALSYIRKNLLKPYKEKETEKERKQYREQHPELEEVIQIIEEIDRNNIPPYLRNVREIKKWMEEYNTTRPPRAKSEDKEEKVLGLALSTIRQELLKPYIELGTIEEKEQYKIKHPELEEVMKTIDEIDRNNIPTYLRNVQEIKNWMEKCNTNKPPRANTENEEEKRLGRALSTIRKNLLKPYNELQTIEEKERYKEEHPELEYVMQVVNEIDNNNLPAYLRNAQEIKNWMDERNITKPPRSNAQNEEEKKLGSALSTIRQELLKPYIELGTIEEKEQYKIKHPELEEVMQIIEEIDRNNVPTYLRNAREIKNWMKEHGTTRPPRTNAEDKEKTLGKALISIRQELLKPYSELQTNKEKEEYKVKHPELEEIMQIIEEIDKNNIPTYLRNAQKIKNWMKEYNTTRPPRTKSEDKEEKVLGLALSTIRQELLKPYIEFQTIEEKEQYKGEHPELEEVMQIVEEIDRNNVPTYLRNVREIKNWMEDNNTTKYPSKKSQNKLERSLGMAFYSIKQRLIKPYEEKETEEERKQYREQHPELEEVMQIVEEIEKNNPKKVTKRIKEVIVENKQELHNNIEVTENFSDVIKEVEKEEQNYGR